MDAPQFSLITAVKPGRLSKSFKLDNKGGLQKIPGGQLVKGEVRRVCSADAKALATLMQAVTPSQALVYGVTVHEAARVVTQDELQKIKENGGLPVIARTREHFKWPEGSSILMFDYDPSDAAEALSAEGFRSAVYEICPAIKEAPHVIAASASSFIYNGTDLVRGARGWRMLVIVTNGRDIPRAGAAFVSRCWLKGKGYIALSKAGSLLERALVDSNVWQPERLDFCGGAHCFPPLVQKRPEPQFFNPDAEPLDTVKASPSLSLQEQTEKKRIIKQAKLAAQPAADKKREAWIEARVAEDLKKVPEAERRTVGERLRETYSQAVKTDLLLADFVLQPESGGTVTVGEILEEPAKWHGKRFADPLEPEYQGDRRISVANLYAAGSPYIYSHAHGGRRFTLHRTRQMINMIKGERVTVVEKALEMMCLHGRHYRRGGEIVKLGPDGEVTPREAQEICFDLDGLARWFKWDKRGKTWEPADCTPSIAIGVCASQENRKLPVLDAVATAPILDPRTGRLIDRDGYDASSRLVLILGDLEKWPGVAENPSPIDVENAIISLWKPFEKFPFVGAIDRGVMLAAVLTTVIRPLLPTAPAFAFDAPVAGSGKTLLAKCLSELAGDCPPAVFPSAEKEDEIRKRLLAILRINKRVVVMDNIDSELESASLCGLLTTEVYRDRIMGESVILTLPTRTLIVITGNNLVLRGDLCRRVLTARIDPEIELPWTRRFELDPAEHCREHRLEMVAAALTILRAGMQHGAALQDRTASFELWSDTVRQAVVYASSFDTVKLEDPILSINTALETDSETAKLRAFLTAVFAEWEDSPVTVAELVKKALRRADPDKNVDGKQADETLLNVLKEIAGDKGGVNNKALGKWLTKHRERIVGGLRLMSAERGHGGHRKWRVRQR